jgi:UDP-N-acetylglucosamine 2-epimerase
VHVVAVVGTRPNFIKMAPVVAALQERSGVRSTLVHTGQHFDRAMSTIFFEELQLPEPDFHLDVGQMSPWQQTGTIIDRLGGILAHLVPDWEM